MEKVKAPSWFMPVVTILLIWDLIGIAAFGMDLMMPEEMISELPIEQQELYSQTPDWTKLFYGIATIGAFLGCIGLLMKKAWAKPLFLVSLLAVLIQFGHSLFVLGALDVMGPTALIMPVIVTLVGTYQVWLSSKGVKKGWLI